MGESNLSEMSLPSLFEQARKIHLLATQSSADKVFFCFYFILYYKFLIFLEF